MDDIYQSIVMQPENTGVKARIKKAARHALGTLKLCISGIIFTVTGLYWLHVSLRACVLLLEGSLQDIQDGFADFVFEILAHEHVQQWIQAAVNKGQAWS